MKEQKLAPPLVDRLKVIPGVFGIRFGEKQRYEVLLEKSGFELRQYEDVVIATTTVLGKFSEASEEGFERLARYILGENHTHENFPTTPTLLQSSGSRKLCMTTPVLQSEEAGGWSMSFVLPKNERFSAAPHPNDDRVKLRPVASCAWAVIRFTGRIVEGELRRREHELRHWISQTPGLRAIDEVRCAQYDSPLTIPFLRRNEIQIRVEPATRFQ